MSTTETKVGNPSTDTKNGNDDLGGAMLRHAITPGGHTLDQTQPGWPVYHRKLANPAPLGLMSFAATTLLLSFVNTHTRGVTIPNGVVGMALAYGGLGQLLAGMWEGAAGNTFGFTAFSSYGCFWISYAVILWPSSGILTAYTGTDELSNFLGLYLAVWFIITFAFLISSFKSSAGLVALFFFLDLTFLLLACGNLVGSTRVTEAGGGFGILTAFIAFYCSVSGLLTPDTSYFLFPTGDLSKND